MPDFVSALVASAVFCLALMALNALTRLLVHWHAAPQDLAENGLLQVGAALVLARVAYKRAPGRRLTD